jgi:transcription elongation factor GreA-like protein
MILTVFTALVSFVTNAIPMWDEVFTEVSLKCYSIKFKTFVFQFLGSDLRTVVNICVTFDISR